MKKYILSLLVMMSLSAPAFAVSIDPVSHSPRSAGEGFQSFAAAVTTLSPVDALAQRPGNVFRTASFESAPLQIIASDDFIIDPPVYQIDPKEPGLATVPESGPTLALFVGVVAFMGLARHRSGAASAVAQLRG